jgi:multidrug efflux pump
VMVPVMVTAPTVIWRGWVGNAFRAVGRGFGGRKHTATAVTPEGTEIAIPEGIDSTQRFIKTDGSGLVETEQDGVTVVSRQAAE